jgi:hypothetical protein
MMLAAAVAASPRRREAAFMFPEGTACCQFCLGDGINRSLEETEENFVSTLCIHFPNDTRQMGRPGGLF